MASANVSSALWERALRGETFDDVLIVDAHTHMGRLAEFHIPRPSDEKGMLLQMDRLGVNRAVCAPFLAWGPSPEDGHAYLADVLRRFPDRFSGYVVYNPSFGTEYSLAQLEKWFGEPGFLGIKIAPSTHGYPADGPAYEPMWSWANERSLPVLSHTWRASPEDHPGLFVRVGRRFPNVKILLGHSGGDPAGMHEAIEAAKQCPNLYLELASSQTAFGIVELMVRELGAERVVYGTDIPFIDGRWKLGQVLAAKIPDRDKEKILGQNAVGIFGLDRNG